MGFADMFYQGWEGILRTVVVGTLAHVALVALLRITGNRTLSKLNAFDLVVAVALGSVLASILLSEGVALAEGVTAFLLLIGLQYLVAVLSVNSRGFAKLVRSELILPWFGGRSSEVGRPWRSVAWARDGDGGSFPRPSSARRWSGCARAA